MQHIMVYGFLLKAPSAVASDHTTSCTFSLVIENDVKTTDGNEKRPAIYTIIASGGLASFVLKTIRAGAAVVVKGTLRDDSPCRLDPTWNHWLVMASSVSLLTGELPAGHAHLLSERARGDRSIDTESLTTEDQVPL